MQRGLSKKLMKGVPQLNSDMSVTVTANDGSIIHVIPSSALARGGIGYLYERIVGLHYERIGYSVEYRCHLGFMDRGVDLVAKNETECHFIQCKFTLKSMSRAKVESLLFAASAFVQKNLEPISNHFDLVVPSKETAFPERRQTAQRAFFRYNTTQRQVRLNIVEVPIEVPELLLGGTNENAT